MDNLYGRRNRPLIIQRYVIIGVRRWEIDVTAGHNYQGVEIVVGEYRIVNTTVGRDIHGVSPVPTQCCPDIPLDCVRRIIV